MGEQVRGRTVREPVRQIHVLLVDDEPGFAEMTGEFLERELDALTVTTETSARDGLARLRSTDIDAIVSDYNMPEMDGLEFLHAVREDHPDLPFILFTGKGSEEIASDAISAGVTDYLQKGGGSDQYTLLANRIRNAVAQYRNKHRRETLERIRTLVNDINQALVRASSREKIERSVCDILADADPYRAAVIAEVTPDTKHIEPRAYAGAAEAFFDDFEMSVAEDAPGRHAPGGRAFHDRELAIAQDLQTDPSYEPWRELAVEHGFQSLAVVPLDYEGDFYGLLAVFADRPHAFDETEQDLLVELAEDIAHAMYAQDVQADLRESTRRFEAVFEDPQMLVGVLAPDGTVRQVNQTAMAYVDADVDAVVGEPFWETPWWPAEMQADVQQWIDRASTGEYVEFEADLSGPAGIGYSVYGTVRPVTDAEGDVVSLVVSARDITERKRHERDLEVYETIIEATPDGIYALDSEFEFITVNEIFEQRTGLSEADILGEHVSVLIEQDVLPERELDKTQEEVRRLLTGETDSIRFEQTIQTPSGELIVETRMARFPDGDRYGVVSVARDITAQKEREQRLRRSQRRFKAVFNSPESFIGILDPDGTLLDVNERALDFIEADAEDVVGYPFWETPWWTHSAELQERVKDWVAQAAGGEYVRFESSHRAPDGTELTVDGVIRPVIDEDGEVVSLVAESQDITERKEHQRKLERQNQRLAEFASVVSHDLRNPLNIADGRMELAQETGDPAHFEAVKQALDRMDTLIEDLLILARQGEMVEAPELVNLTTVATKAWTTVASTEEDATLSVVADDIPVAADPERLRQALENLFRNAIKHAGPNVTVEIGRLSDGTGVYVADDGPGIPPAEREQVFERGYTTSDDGTGFGLAIVQEIVEAHGWTIEVTESTAGGARFEIMCSIKDTLDHPS